MKTLFIPAKIKSSVNLLAIQEISKTLPKEIAIAYSIQYEDIAKKIKQILSKNHKITKFIQVLGCSTPIFQDTQAILLISSGRFHAVSSALESNLPVYILQNHNIQKISEREIESLKIKKRAAYLKFLHSDKVGILVSTKPGQENLKRAIELKKSLDKKSYLFIGDNISPAEFQNFHVDSWINTACPRLDFDVSVVNVMDLEK